MKVTVCIPTIRPDTVGDAVASILLQQHENWELIVVGQGDEEIIRPVVERAAGGDPRVHYMHLDRRGLSIARNCALEDAEGDVVAFTDDDCQAPPDWLESLVREYERRPEVGLVAGALTKPAPKRGGFRVCPEFTPRELLYDPTTSGGHAPDGWSAIGANFSVRRDVALRIGGFDEHLGAGARFAAAEETDYVLRAERLGVPMYSTPEVTVHHTHGYRYGLRAVYAHRRAYARGNGALAAKLSLLGDDRGRSWLANEIRAATIEPLRTLRPHQLPIRLLRLRHFASAYRQCSKRYRVWPGEGPEAPVRATLQANRAEPDAR